MFMKILQGNRKKDKKKKSKNLAPAEKKFASHQKV